MRLLRSLAMVAAVVAGAWPGFLAAQQVGTGSVVQSYVFADPASVGMRRADLWTVPFVASVPVGDRVAFGVGGAYARGSVTFEAGDRVTIAGPTDGSVQVAASIGRVVLKAGATVPTGETALTVGEASLVGLMSAQLLPFEVTSWGTGGLGFADFDVGGTVGRSTVRVGLGYAVGREYELVAGESGGYLPGSQARLRLVGMSKVGEASSFTWMLAGQKFSEDEYGGTRLYQAGVRLEGALTFGFPIGARESAAIYAGLYRRGEASTPLAGALIGTDPYVGVRLLGVAPSPARGLVRAGVEAQVTRGKLMLLPSAELRILRTGDGLGQGWLASAGLSADRVVAGGRYGSRWVLTPSVRARMGRVIPREGSESSVSGWEAGLTLRWEAGR